MSLWHLASCLNRYGHTFSTRNTWTPCINVTLNHYHCFLTTLHVVTVRLYGDLFFYPFGNNACIHVDTSRFRDVSSLSVPEASFQDSRLTVWWLYLSFFWWHGPVDLSRLSHWVFTGRWPFSATAPPPVKFLHLTCPFRVISHLLSLTLSVAC